MSLCLDLCDYVTSFSKRAPKLLDAKVSFFFINIHISGSLLDPTDQTTLKRNNNNKKWPLIQTTKQHWAAS